MSSGLDQPGDVSGSNASGDDAIVDATPLRVRLLPGHFDRLAEDLNADAAYQVLQRLPELLVNPPQGTDYERIIAIIDHGARAFAGIGVAHARSAGRLTPDSTAVLEGLDNLRQRLLETDRRDAPGVIRASSVVAGVEAEAYVVMSRSTSSLPASRAGGVKKAVSSLMSHYQTLLGLDLDGVSRHRVRADDSLRAPIASFVDCMIHRDSDAKSDSLFRDVDEMFAALVVDRPTNAGLVDSDQQSFGSLFAGVLSDEIERRLLDPELEDVADALSFEGDLRSSASRVRARLRSSGSALARLDYLFDEIARTVHFALVTELDRYGASAEFVDMRERSQLVAEYAFQSKLLRTIDSKSTAFVAATDAMVRASQGSLTMLGRALDRVLDERFVVLELPLPPDTYRSIGDQLQVDCARPGTSLGQYVREGLWGALSQAGMVDSLQRPSSERGWMVLWNDLSSPADEQDLRQTLRVRDDVTERVLADVVGRARIAELTNSIRAEMFNAAMVRSRFINWWDEAVHDRNSVLPPTLEECADKLTRALADFAQRVSIDEELARHMSTIDEYSAHQRAARHPDDIAALSVVSIERVAKTRAATGAYIPPAFFRAREKLIAQFELGEGEAFWSSSALARLDIPRPKDASY